MLVLLVGKRSPHLGRHEGSLGRLLLSAGGRVAALVGPNVVQVQDKSNERAAGLGAHDGNLGRPKVGSIASLEGLRTDDIAEGEGAADDGGGEGSLGSAAKVGGSPGVKDGEGGDNGINQVDPGKAALTVCNRKERHESATKDTREMLVDLFLSGWNDES
jgi:hypothetical protein